MAGTTDEQFCVQWNDHRSTLVSVLDTLLKNEILVDCTLAAEGQYLRAHRVVLSACSPTLETLLSQHYSNHPILIFNDLKFINLKHLLGYMYHGEVDIPPEHLGSFLKAAESLQIKGISEMEKNDDNTLNGPYQSKSSPSSVLSRSVIDSTSSSVDGYGKPQMSRKRRKIRNSINHVSTVDSNFVTKGVCDRPNQGQSVIPKDSKVQSTIPLITNKITSANINQADEFKIANAPSTSSPQFGKSALVKINPPSLTSPQFESNCPSNQIKPSIGIMRGAYKRHKPLLKGDNEYSQGSKAFNNVEDSTLADDHYGDGFVCESYVPQMPQTSSTSQNSLAHNKEQFKSKQEFDTMKSDTKQSENYNVLMGSGVGENLPSVVNVKCFSCGKIFASKYNLKRHQRSYDCRNVFL